jgi:crotonobetainyl-CoA:carnitine CoA-transferase CaiB-like acyl-CoA transferase
MLLGDMGAEVIKVEIPGGGDELRNLFRFPGRAADTEDYFGMWNRNKRSLALDIKSDLGKQMLTDLIGISDVFIHNLAPGAVERLGLGWETVHALNERMVYVSISGFGPDDPRRAYDTVVQAASGAMDQTGYPDGPPTRSAIAIGDLMAAFFAAFTTVNALVLAMKNGRGTRVDVAMVDCLLALLAGDAAEYLSTGRYSGRLGCETPHRVPHNAYQTADSRYVFVVSNNEIWPRLCRALGLESYIDDPRFQANQDRVMHRELVNTVIGDRLRDLSATQASELLTLQNVPHSIVATIPEAIDELAAGRGMIVEIAGALRDGREPIRVMGPPYQMSQDQPAVRFGPPRLGEANDYVIHDLLGYPYDRPSDGDTPSQPPPTPEPMPLAEPGREPKAV